MEVQRGALSRGAHLQPDYKKYALYQGSTTNVTRSDDENAGNDAMACSSTLSGVAVIDTAVSEFPGVADHL